MFSLQILRNLTATVLLCFLLTSQLIAQNPAPHADSIRAIHAVKDSTLKQRQWVTYVRSFMLRGTVSDAVKARNQIASLLTAHKIPAAAALIPFMDGILYDRQRQYKKAEAFMLKAVGAANRMRAIVFLYHFYTHLAFIYTSQGAYNDAITSYALANRQSTRLQDKQLQLLLDINFSDLYYKAGLYKQSLGHLDQAEDYLSQQPERNSSFLLSLVYYNKAENYFRMKQLDSFTLYHQRYRGTPNTGSDWQNNAMRLDYYHALLRQEYGRAVNLVASLKSRPGYSYYEWDDLHLAEAFFHSGMPDSTVSTVRRIFKEHPHTTPPEIKVRLYQMLAEVESGRGQYQAASQLYDSALHASQLINNRLAAVGNVSSEIQIEQIENQFSTKTARYERMRVWMLLVASVSVLLIVIIALVYRNVINKRRYEALLFATKKRELAFIHSHEVRKHLANILGIIELLMQSEEKATEYARWEAHLFNEASLLDQAIRNISSKLSE